MSKSPPCRRCDHLRKEHENSVWDTRCMARGCHCEAFEIDPREGSWYIANVDQSRPLPVGSLAEARALLGVKTLRRAHAGCYVTTTTTTNDEIAKRREFWVCRGRSEVERLGFLFEEQHS